jgi:polyribonucleotide 5'-hydroxyl-kinase
MTDERISVIKLTKSGGCVDRDAAFMKAFYESQIRSYFFGHAVSATGASVISLSTGPSSTTKVTLSPHAQQLDFNSIALFQYAATSSAFGDLSRDQDVENSYRQDDDSDEYDPDFLPGDTTTSETDPAGGTSSDIPLKKLTSPPPAALANTLIAVTHSPPNAHPAEIRDASVMGFLYVADVDAEKNRIRVLAPIGGRIPSRALIWGKKWPGEVVGLVG